MALIIFWCIEVVLCISLVLVFVIDKRNQKKRAIRRMKQKVWELERDIEGCFDYVSIVSMNGRVNRVFKRWYKDGSVSVKILDTEYRRLIQIKDQKQQKYFDRLIGSSGYDEDEE